MKLKVTNNRKAPYGVEKAGGGYAFIDPGATRIVDCANPAGIYGKDFLIVEAEDSEVEAPPKSISATAAKVGREPPAPILEVEEVLNAEVVEEKPSPLDHDGKEGRGGSVKGFHSTAAKGARRRRKAASK